MMTKLKTFSLAALCIFSMGLIMSITASEARADVESAPGYTATTGTLIVIKTVVNDNAGTSVASDFTLWLEHAPGGVTSTSSFPGDANGTKLEVAAGGYGITESPFNGYSVSLSADCTGTMNPGDVKTCTVTNDDDAPAVTATGTLMIVKTVVNDQGGTAVASDFSIDVGLTTSSTSATSTVIGNASGTAIVLEVGSYNVSESAPSPYVASYSGDCSGYLAAGEIKTCTVTNDDTSNLSYGTLIVIKKVENNYGLNYASKDFTIHVNHRVYNQVNGSMVRMATSAPPATTTTSFAGNASGTTLQIGLGDYSVTEDEDNNFDAIYSKDCIGTMIAGATKTCTIINRAKEPRGGGTIILPDDPGGDECVENCEDPGYEPTDECGKDGCDASSSTSTEPVPRVLGIEDVAKPTVLCMLTEEEAYFISSDVNIVLAHVGKVRDTELEKHYADFLTPGIIPADLDANQKAAIVNFVTYGTLSNQRLGQGERAGVVNSYHAIYGRLPLTDCDWQNAIKIANTTLPLDLVPERETKMLSSFETIYGRKADLNNDRDNVAIKVMSYGIRPQIRDISAEWDAVMVFEQIFGKRPKTATEWDANRAIAYSGVAHPLLSRDLTNAASRIMSIRVKNEPVR